MGSAPSSHSRTLTLAAARGDVAHVRLLLALHAAQQQSQIRTHPPHPAHAGHSHGRKSKSKCEELIPDIDPKCRVDIDQPLPEGDFALELAAIHGHVEIVRMLLEAGANPNQQDRSGLTALHVVCHEGGSDQSLEIVRLLLAEAKARVDVQDSEGNTALHFAAEFGHHKHIALLIQHGAPIDTRNKLGATPLLHAAVFDRWDAVRLLLNAGADPDIVGRVHKKGTNENGGMTDAILGPICARQFLPPDMSNLLTQSLMVRRIDRIIHTLYPELVGSVVEEILEYDEVAILESRMNRKKYMKNTSSGSSSSSSSSSNSSSTTTSNPLIVSRLLHYMSLLQVAQEREAAENSRRRMSKIHHATVTASMHRPTSSSVSASWSNSASAIPAPASRVVASPNFSDEGSNSSGHSSGQDSSTPIARSASSPLAPPSKLSSSSSSFVSSHHEHQYSTSSSGASLPVLHLTPSPAPSSPQPASSMNDMNSNNSKLTSTPISTPVVNRMNSSFPFATASGSGARAAVDATVAAGSDSTASSSSYASIPGRATTGFVAPTTIPTNANDVDVASAQARDELTDGRSDSDSLKWNKRDEEGERKYEEEQEEGIDQTERKTSERKESTSHKRKHKHKRKNRHQRSHHGTEPTSTWS